MLMLFYIFVDVILLCFSKLGNLVINSERNSRIQLYQYGNDLSR